MQRCARVILGHAQLDKPVVGFRRAIHLIHAGGLLVHRTSSAERLSNLREGCVDGVCNGYKSTSVVFDCGGHERHRSNTDAQNHLEGPSRNIMSDIHSLYEKNYRVMTYTKKLTSTR